MILEYLKNPELYQSKDKFVKICELKGPTYALACVLAGAKFARIRFAGGLQVINTETLC